MSHSTLNSGTLHLTEESEKRLRALVMASSDVIYRMSPDWKIMYSLDGRGVLTDTGQANDQWMDQYVLQHDRKYVQQAIDKAIETKSNFELEYQLPLSDGTIGWIYSKAVPIMDDNNEIIEWFGTATNITSQKNAQSELEQTKRALEISKGLYEAIVSSTPDLIYVFNLEYKFIYANKALLNMWGTTEAEAAGKGLRELGYEEWHATMHEREIDEVVATKQLIRGEVSFPHAILGRRIYDYIFAPVFNDNGEVVAVAGTTRDISDLKIAENALKQSEEQFRSLTQSLPQLIWMADKEGNCSFLNNQWFEYTGAIPDELLGEQWLQYIHPEQQDTIVAKWKKSTETGKPFSVEFQLKKQDGNYNWFYATSNPIRDDEGTIFKWVGSLTNIDEQKAIEEKLESVVKDRTRALQRSNDDLLQFAHVASHDLKEPLRKVRTFASRLERELGNGTNDNIQQCLQKIYSATDRMNNMIEGVLAYSTLSNLQQQTTNVDLTNVISNIEADLEVAIQQKGAQIQYSKLPIIKGSPVLLYQLFYNLINNSLKFARQGQTPVILIEAKETTKSDGNIATEITFADNGIGFSQEHAEKIFHTFTRLNSKDLYEGTGLGLALCKKIVERHDGTINATGKEGAGATFVIELP